MSDQLDHPVQPDENEKAREEWYERKSAFMRATLGKPCEVVGHALIPFCIGGPLDEYYYLPSSGGTAIATMELSDLPGAGPSNDVFESFELVMFTRRTHAMAMDELPESSGGELERSIASALNPIARYAFTTELNRYETIGFPRRMFFFGGRWLVIDAYGLEQERAEFGLMLVMEIFHREQRWARRHGGDALIQRLKDAGHYPYSDLDRQPVV